MSLMGVKIDQFDVPVCNSFKARVLNGRLCYEVDMKDFANRANINDLKKGLIFVLHYKKDRQTLQQFNKTVNAEGSKFEDLAGKGSIFLKHLVQ